MSSKPLAGRVALITGGSRGIGRGIALELAKAGASIAVNYRRDEDAAAATVAEIETTGGVAIPARASVEKVGELERLAARVRDELGPIGILVCNAGTASRGKRVTDTDADEPAAIVSTHALSAHHLARLVVPGMRELERGDVVMISSNELATMRAGGAPYNMAKAALEALAATLAREELDNGIHVNVVAPGLVATEMGDRLVGALFGAESVAALAHRLPFKRACQPADVGRVVRFLCSEDASYLTGQRLVVDGGRDVLEQLGRG